MIDVLAAPRNALRRLHGFRTFLHHIALFPACFFNRSTASSYAFLRVRFGMRT